MKRFISTVIRNTVFVNVTLVLVLLAGAVASNLMVREMFPEISVDVLTISVIYPGADPEETEEGVSRKIEQVIDGLDGIKQYRTVSSENSSMTMIDVTEGYDTNKLYTDVRNAVDSISNFPVDAEKPIISEITLRNPVILLSLWGDLPERVLKETAERMKDELQALPSVSQVSISGTRDYEIAIEVSEERLQEYGLSFRDVSSAVRQGSLNLGGGQVRTKGEEIRLRTVGRKYTAEEFASIVVVARPDGEIITLGRLADIRDGFMEDDATSTFNGHPSVTLSVSKTPSEDSIAIAREVREYAEAKEAQLPEGVNATIWSDESVYIEGRIDMLLRNGFIGLIIVFFSIWMFLDLRLSFWVTMGIPISLSGGLVIMWFVGATLNELSLFGLIMVLGILVDDAIIIGESIYVHRKNGDPPLLAATNGVIEVGLPVIAAVTTSIIAFIPLLFVKGVLGKFIEIIPVAVIASLTMSLIESVFLLPAHLNNLPDLASDAQKKHRGLGRIRQGMTHGLEWFVEHLYVPFLGKAIHFRYVTFCAAVLVFMVTIGVMRGGFLKFVLFPESDQTGLVAAIEFPRGTPPSITADAIRQTEEALRRYARGLPKKDGKPIWKNIQTVMGHGGGELGFDSMPGNHTGYVRVELYPSRDRLVQSQEISVGWQKAVGTIPGALSQSFQTNEMGPPGAPIMISLRGEDMGQLRALSEELKAQLRTYDGVHQVSDSYRPGKNELRLDIKPEARALGLTLQDLGAQVYAGYFGEEALRIQRGRDDIRVRVRYNRDHRSTLAQLDQVRIRTPQGNEVPFFSVADVTFAEGYSDIVRTDGALSLNVTAENDPKVANADEVLADMAATILPRLEAENPGVFSWQFEGPEKESRDAFAGLFVSFPLALIGIFVVIATIFRSYIQPLLIMVTVPFGIIGGVWAHLLLGYDLSMMSVFGMVGLTGIVVNDAIVLIEAINRNIAANMPVFEAIGRGGARRFRAILLTTTSTIGGLVPIIIETETGAERVVGMALSMAGGVLFATVLTLVYVPCLLAILNDFRRMLFFLVHKRYPSREEVEPARLRNLDLLHEDTGELAPAQ